MPSESTTTRPAKIPLPYFDILLEQLSLGNADMQQIFGRHVHWGYWPDPGKADGSVEDFAIAAEQLSQRMFEVAGVKEGDRVLDVGCGFGGTIASLNEKFQNLQLTGLNIDARQIARANQTIQPLANNQISFVEGDACQLPFPDASVDVVLAVECIFHFPSRAKFFQEARRVLRPGGHLAISDFVSTPVFYTLQKLLSNSGKPLSQSVYGRVDTFFTAKDYKALAQETNFAVTCHDDITHNTLPSYPVVCQAFDQIGKSAASRATSAVGLISRLGLLRYQILGFVAQG